MVGELMNRVEEGDGVGEAPHKYLGRHRLRSVGPPSVTRRR